MSDEGANEASRERVGGRGPRRYRSTYGDWFLPYVDDTKVVYVPPSGPAAFSYLTAGAVAQTALTALSLLLANGVWVSRPVMGRGFAFLCALFPFLLWIGAVPMAVYVSRIIPIRRAPLPRRSRTSPDALTMPKVSTAFYFHHAALFGTGKLFGGRRLWLGLGHRVFELWNVDVSSGGGRRATRETDWVEERLVSPQEGALAEARNEGNGGINLPVIDSLRTVLGIGPEQRIRLGWLPFPGRVGLTLLGVGAASWPRVDRDAHWLLTRDGRARSCPGRRNRCRGGRGPGGCTAGGASLVPASHARPRA